MLPQKLSFSFPHLWEKKIMEYNYDFNSRYICMLEYGLKSRPQAKTLIIRVSQAIAISAERGSACLKQIKENR